MNLRVRYFCAIAALAAPMALTGAANADVLMGWDVHTLPGGNSVFGPSSFAATTSATGIASPIGLTRGSGIVTTGVTAATRAWGGVNMTTTTSAAAIAANDFVSFGFTVADGYTISLSSIDEFYRRKASGPSGGLWQYAINGGSFTDIAPVSFTSSSNAGATLSPFTLTGISDLQDMSAGTSVTFRLALYGGTITTGDWYVYDTANSTAPDLALNGTVVSPLDDHGSAVPEPTTVALLALGTLALFQRRRAA
ncbi:MAG: PEP-CTERM sorting domain-containing protein [Phycisphaeraceae bacterium]